MNCYSYVRIKDMVAIVRMRPMPLCSGYSAAPREYLAIDRQEKGDAG